MPQKRSNGSKNDHGMPPRRASRGCPLRAGLSRIDRLGGAPENQTWGKRGAPLLVEGFDTLHVLPGRRSGAGCAALTRVPCCPLFCPPFIIVSTRVQGFQLYSCMEITFWGHLWRKRERERECVCVRERADERERGRGRGFGVWGAGFRVQRALLHT